MAKILLKGKCGFFNQDVEMRNDRTKVVRFNCMGVNQSDNIRMLKLLVLTNGRDEFLVLLGRLG